MLRHLILLCVLFALSACATNPLGINDEDWERMPLEERQRAYERQAEIDLARAERQAAEARVREAEALQEAARREELRQRALYGDRVQCVIRDGEGYLGANWRRIEALGFEAIRGIHTEFEMIEHSGSRTRRIGSGFAFFDGITLRLCRTSSAQGCTGLAATTRELERGLELRVDADRLLRGTMFCALPDSRPGRR